MDEIDGKQARRTGNTSPLGLLFDHGFDSYSVGFCVQFFCKVLQLGDGVHPLLIQQLINFVFHVTTVEQYYTGELILSIGNFVSDGCFPLAFLYCYIGHYGNSWWSTVVWKEHELTPTIIFLYVMYGVGVINFLER